MADYDYTGAKGASGVNIIAGLWLFLSAFFITGVGNATTNNIIVGLVVAALAAIRYFGAPTQTWLSWVNALLGLWTIISPWALGFSVRGGMTTNNVIVGIVMVVFGVWAAIGTPRTTTTGGTVRAGV